MAERETTVLAPAAEEKIAHHGQEDAKSEADDRSQDCHDRPEEQTTGILEDKMSVDRKADRQHNSPTKRAEAPSLPNSIALMTFLRRLSG